MNDREKWNKKHTERLEQMKEPAANPRLLSLSNYLNGGTALDLACGLGANSMFLAEMNFRVKAIDISDVAINYLHEKTDKFKLTIDPQVFDLTDINNLNLENCFYNLVVITYYLDRRLFPIVKRIIKENGYLFMETFFESPQNEKPSVPRQYKLQFNELLSEFADWKILFFEENEQEGRQTIFCQRG